jgi:hypothetical protein
MHLRAQIRASLVVALTGLPTTGANASDSEVYALDSPDLPALNVATPSEQATTETLVEPLALDRRLRFVVEGLAKASTPGALTALLDQISLEVEIALANPCAALFGLAKDITLQTTVIEKSGAGEKPAGRVTLTYEVTYWTAEGAPDTSI